jgi:hypothetical protein
MPGGSLCDGSDNIPTGEVVTKYIIKLPSPYPGPADTYVAATIHDEIVLDMRKESAMKFDSATEAEIFALTNHLVRYTVEMIQSDEPAPIPTHDLGGES